MYTLTSDRKIISFSLSPDEINNGNSIGDCDCKMILNLENKEIRSYDQSSLYYFEFHIANRSKPIYLLDDEGNHYTLFGVSRLFDTGIGFFCRFIKIMESKTKFVCKEELEVRKIEYELEYAHANKINYRDIIKETKIKKNNGDTIVLCLKDFCDNNAIVSISVESSKKKTKSLEKHVTDVMDLMFLFFGVTPKIIRTIYYDGDDEVSEYGTTFPKYEQNFASSNNAVLIRTTKNALSEKTINEFNKFKEQTYVLFNSLMVYENSDLKHYPEILCSLLVQILCGLAEYKANIKNNGKRKTINENYALDSFVNKGETMLIFKHYINKKKLKERLIENRDCHTHVRKWDSSKGKKPTLVELERYNEELFLSVRVFILQQLGLRIYKNRLIKCIGLIREKYRKVKKTS